VRSERIAACSIINAPQRDASPSARAALRRNAADSFNRALATPTGVGEPEEEEEEEEEDEEEEVEFEVDDDDD